MKGTELAPIDAVIVEQVDTDATLIDAWLQGLPESTQRQYTAVFGKIEPETI